MFLAGDGGIGMLLAARGLGALLGPLLGRRLAGDAPRRLVAWSGGAIVAYGCAYALLPAAPSLLVALAVVTTVHLGGGYQWVASTQGLQTRVPDALRARVLSLDFALATLAIGLSSLGAAALAELLPLRGATWALAGISVTYGLAWLGWTRDLWRHDTPGDRLGHVA